jgi:uncharacterized protein
MTTNYTPELSRKAQICELLVFLALIIPSMVISLLSNELESGSFTLTAWAIIMRNLSLVALIVFFIWRNRESALKIGWNFQDSSKEVVLGLFLYVAMLFFLGYIEAFFQAVGLTMPQKKLQLIEGGSWQQYSLATLLVVIVAFAEETIFRGYLMLRLQAITRSGAAAIILSSLIFALGHGYEGTLGVATVGVIGALFGCVYRWRKSLVAPMTMHFCQDFIGIVLLPLASP